MLKSCVVYWSRIYTQCITIIIINKNRSMYIHIIHNNSLIRVEKVLVWSKCPLSLLGRAEEWTSIKNTNTFIQYINNYTMYTGTRVVFLPLAKISCRGILDLESNTNYLIALRKMLIKTMNTYKVKNLRLTACGILYSP